MTLMFDFARSSKVKSDGVNWKPMGTFLPVESNTVSLTVFSQIIPVTTNPTNKRHSYTCRNRSTMQHYVLQDGSKKFAQSNLGRGPRCGAVAHVRRKVPIGYNGALQIRPQMYPFPWTDPQTALPASSLDPSDLWCQTPPGMVPDPIRRFSTMHWTDRPTHVRTDRQIVHGKVWRL